MIGTEAVLGLAFMTTVALTHPFCMEAYTSECSQIGQNQKYSGMLTLPPLRL